MSSRGVKTSMAAAVAAVGIAAVAPLVWHVVVGDSKSMAPPPALFPASALGAVDASTGAAAARARPLARAWLRAHPTATETAFATWALAQVPPPPSGAASKAELRRVEQAAAGRTPEQSAAALWLEQYGKKAVWKTYVKQAKPFLAAATAARAKRALKAALALGTALTTREKELARRPSPYEVDPKLAAINRAKFQGQVRYSYPSKHDVLAFAALAILDRIEPRRGPEFRWMADEVSYSRLVGGGHYPSDLDAGAFLGTLVGEYEAGRAELP